MFQLINLHLIKGKLYHMFSKKKRAVSPLIATILIFALIILGVGIGLMQTLPYIEMTKSNAALTNLQTAFNQIDYSINDLLNEGIEADNTVSNDNRGQRFITLTKSTGKLDFPSEANYFNLRIVDDDREPLYNGSTGIEIDPVFGINDIALGRFDYSFSTTAAIIPIDTWKYMNGPQVYSRRSAISVIAPAKEESYNKMVNLTLSYTRADYKYHLRLDYRPKVLISIKFTPVPEIRISTYVIQITGPDTPIYDVYSQLLLSLSSIDYQANSYTLRSDVSELAVQTKSHPASGWVDCWTSNMVQGLRPAYYRISLITTIYHFTVS
ncbi:MAG: hypothetical protein ACTSP4_04610 [Candidatus Hodarchaeales archaeon]